MKLKRVLNVTSEVLVLRALDSLKDDEMIHLTYNHPVYNPNSALGIYDVIRLNPDKVIVSLSNYISLGNMIIAAAVPRESRSLASSTILSIADMRGIAYGRFRDVINKLDSAMEVEDHICQVMQDGYGTQPTALKADMQKGINVHYEDLINYGFEPYSIEFTNPQRFGGSND